MWWVWRFLAFRLLMAPRGTQPCFRLHSRMHRRYRNRHLGDITVILINLVQWVWTILDFRLIRALKGAQPCFRFLSRVPGRYANGHMGDTLVSLINLVQWFQTFCWHPN